MANCKHCGKPLPARRSSFCTRQCSKNFEKAQYRAKFPESRLSKPTVGAMSELRVAVDLLSKGYEVFRAVSPACSCDLIALRDGQTLRIEVRTANFRPNNRASMPRTPADAGKQDHFAFVLPNSISYEPALNA